MKLRLLGLFWLHAFWVLLNAKVTMENRDLWAQIVGDEALRLSLGFATY